MSQLIRRVCRRRRGGFRAHAFGFARKRGRFGELASIIHRLVQSRRGTLELLDGVPVLNRHLSRFILQFYERFFVMRRVDGL